MTKESNKRPSKVGRISACLLSALMLLQFAPLGVASASSYKESLVRAAVIFGILRFTEWPEDNAPQDSIRLCTIGESASSEAISSLKQLPAIGQVSVDHVKIKSWEAGTQCHAAVLGKDIQLPDSAFRSMLLICDGCSDQMNSMAAISLARQDNKIRFEINLDRVEEQKLSLSSSLIELASKCSSASRSIRGCNDD